MLSQRLRIYLVLQGQQLMRYDQYHFMNIRQWVRLVMAGCRIRSSRDG